MEKQTPHNHRACAPASTGGDDPDSLRTTTHAPEGAPEEREWKRGERCRSPEERAAKKAYFKARKLELQRTKRASNPRIDYQPSEAAYERLQSLVARGMTYSSAINYLLHDARHQQAGRGLIPCDSGDDCPGTNS